MSALRCDGFDRFFEELWGYPPFPWQSALVRRVVDEGWPEALDLPTASGKTAAIDVAVFGLALEATRGAERRAPIRTFFVVDRRLVVDSAYRRASDIAQRLAAAKDGVLGAVADQLRHLAEDPEVPLRVARLRGGMPKEPDWARSAAQPTVVVSTVDQVGSRLLFRGYGVSPSMRPVHAGLVGTDSLLLLDEAHLSRAFAQTATAIAELQQQPEGALAERSLRVVTLSATPVAGTVPGFGLTAEDRNHDTLKWRFESRKPARLVKLDADPDNAAADFALELSVLGRGTARTVAVVVNRVATARRVFEVLERRVAQEAEVSLMIGRSRPLDRVQVEERILNTASVGMARPTNASVHFIVATQCMEAGADLDFDALVTELAPLDALRQRFGRLDRVGRLHRAGETPRAVVFATKDATGRNPDPIYGTASGETWKWLQSVATRGKAGPVVDFGIGAWQPPDPELLPQLVAPSASAPFLFPAYAELWAETNPSPAIDPEPALFLHGIGSTAEADVQIVFREDLEDGDLVRERTAALADLFAEAPPSSLEALSLPIGIARRWLADGVDGGDASDIEGVGGDSGEVDGNRARAFRWAGRESERTGPVAAESIRPGDTLVVPASRGGCDRWGWAPGSRGPVEDLTTRAAYEHRRHLVWRLTPAALRTATAQEDARFEGVTRLLLDVDPRYPGTLLSQFAVEPMVPATWRDAAEHLTGRGTGLRLRWIDPEAPGRGAWLLARKPPGAAIESLIGELPRGTEAADDAATTEDDDGSVGGAPVDLLPHLRAVESEVCRQALALGLPEHLCDAVTKAARHHDVGKAHPGFQALLHDTDIWGVDGLPLRAKSGRTFDPRRRRHADWPAQGRHEAWSVRMAEPELSEDREAEVVMHLIGSHHGHGRPWFPVADVAGNLPFVLFMNGVKLPAPADHGLDRLDSGSCERFAALNARFGPWQLAWLEALLRLADHRVSEGGS